MEVRRSEAADAEAGSLLCDRVVEVVNEAYDRGESALWQGKMLRTSVAEVSELLKQGQILLLFNEEKTCMGSVKCVTNLGPDGDVAEMGMLAITKELQGKGLGNLLLKACEDTAKASGCTKLHLELLEPVEGVDPAKKVLDEWYRRKGFVRGEKLDFATSFPDKATQLAMPCTFTLYEKELN